MGYKIISAARDYREQARAMAQDACAQRDAAGTAPEKRFTWIRDTYWPSVAANALQRWFEQHPNASEPDVVAGFTHLMSGLTPAELRMLSKHIVIKERDEGDGTGAIALDDHAEAFDVEYTPLATESDARLCQHLRARAEQLGGRFIEHEGGLIRRHWQAR